MCGCGAFNQCLRLVKTDWTARRADPDIDVPWTGFDLINTFNAWKKTEDAGRTFTVDTVGVAGHWWVALNIEAAELHPTHHHRPRCDGDTAGWAGVDRGLAAFVVAAHADGADTIRITDTPKALAAGSAKQRRLARSLSRKQKGSHNRRDAAAQLARHHHHVANRRRHFLHQVSNRLVKTHDRLAIEDLHVAGTAPAERTTFSISRAIRRLSGRGRPCAMIVLSSATTGRPAAKRIGDLGVNPHGWRYRPPEPSRSTAAAIRSSVAVSATRTCSDPVGP